MKPEKAWLMFPRNRARQSENGIALITTLLLLMLLTGMVVAMVMAINSDMLINGFYRDFRGGFYAADSGLAVVRQDMANQMVLAIPDEFDMKTSQPIAPGTEDTVRNSLIATYGGASYKSINYGMAASWPATFQLDPGRRTWTIPRSPS